MSDKYKAEAEYYKNRNLFLLASIERLQDLVERYRHDECANFRHVKDIHRFHRHKKDF